MPRSRVSRSKYTSVRHTDSLYSFIKRHPADQTPEARWTTNKKANNYGRRRPRGGFYPCLFYKIMIGLKQIRFLGIRTNFIV